MLLVYWVILHFTHGDTQLSTAKMSFLLVAGLITLVVVWRLAEVAFYLSAGNPDWVPVGLNERHSYWPYVVILGFALVASVVLILTYTKSGTNSENRLPILRAFAASCIYLAACRLAWEIVDYVAMYEKPPVVAESPAGEP